MNWLIYIFGWLLISKIIDEICDRINIDLSHFVQYILCWTAIWIWICIKFIK